MSRPDPHCNYVAIRFFNAFWEDVSRCCIYPPDAVFRNSEPEWFDADDNPIPAPEGEDGHHIVILWRMDEPEDTRQTRPRLYAILAAFAHLYSRSVARKDSPELLMVRYAETPVSGGDVPPVNFRLWYSAFLFRKASLWLREVPGSEFEKELPAALSPCPEDVYASAAAQWRTLVYERLSYLLDAMQDAVSYEMLKPVLDEWESYTWQLMDGYDEAVHMRIRSLHSRAGR